MLEILLPLRNPTDALVRTIDSILGQQKQAFTILISDNHSVSGQALIDESQQKLTKAGLTVRLVRPPMEFSRVEHWNWLHFQSQADWLKPLFAGDWLEPEYIATILREIEAHPQCAYLYGSFLRHHANGEPTLEVLNPTTGRYFSAAEMRQKVLRFGMQFGPPSVAVYRREAFIAMGGYRTTLPICADSLLFCALVSRFGGLGILQPLANFYLHKARFSIGLTNQQAETFREKVTFTAALIYHAFTENVPLPLWGLLRFMAREIRQRLREKLSQPAS